jgi:hypothetical protein
MLSTLDLAAIIKAMMEAGCSAEQIASVALAYRAQLKPIAPPLPSRTARQERNARHYQKRKAERLKASESASDSASETVLIRTPLARVEDNSLPKNQESKSIYIERKTEKGDGFAEFMTAPPKRLDGAGSARENRRAYDAAIAAGATPEGLCAAMRDYAGERATVVAKDPQQAKYTLTPASWLDRELWRRPLIALAPNPAAGEFFIPIKRSDPRWDTLEARYRQENGGRRPPLHDHWSYPRAWFAAA